LAIEKFREAYPDMFDILTTVPVTFKFVCEGRVFQSKKPIITVNEANEFIRLNFAPPFHSEIALNDNNVQEFYEALSTLDTLLHCDTFVKPVTLKEGDAVIFDNTRILHGRRSFNARRGSYHFVGAFIGKDEFHAAYRSHFKADIM